MPEGRPGHLSLQGGALLQGAVDVMHVVQQEHRLQLPLVLELLRRLAVEVGVQRGEELLPVPGAASPPEADVRPNHTCYWGSLSAASGRGGGGRHRGRLCPTALICLLRFE